VTCALGSGLTSDIEACLLIGCLQLQSGLVPEVWRNCGVYLQNVFTLKLGQIYNNFTILQVYKNTQIAQSGLVPADLRNYGFCLQNVFTLWLGQIYNSFTILL
jgi:hypothetical protein